MDSVDSAPSWIDAAVSRLYRDSHGVLRVRRAQPNFDAEDVVQGVEQLHDSIAAAEQLDPDMQPVPLDQSGMPVSLSAYCGVSAIEEQAEAEECREDIDIRSFNREQEGRRLRTKKAEKQGKMFWERVNKEVYHRGFSCSTCLMAPLYGIAHLGYSPGFGRAIFCNTCFIDGRHLEMCAVTMELVIPLPRVLVSEKVDKIRGFISEDLRKLGAKADVSMSQYYTDTTIDWLKAIMPLKRYQLEGMMKSFSLASENLIIDKRKMQQLITDIMPLAYSMVVDFVFEKIWHFLAQPERDQVEFPYYMYRQALMNHTSYLLRIKALYEFLTAGKGKLSSCTLHMYIVYHWLWDVYTALPGLRTKVGDVDNFIYYYLPDRGYPTGYNAYFDHHAGLRPKMRLDDFSEAELDNIRASSRKPSVADRGKISASAVMSLVDMLKEYMCSMTAFVKDGDDVTVEELAHLCNTEPFLLEAVTRLVDVLSLMPREMSGRPLNYHDFKFRRSIIEPPLPKPCDLAVSIMECRRDNTPECYEYQ